MTVRFVMALALLRLLLMNLKILLKMSRLLSLLRKLVKSVTVWAL